jgi:hypothetical protein
VAKHTSSRHDIREYKCSECGYSDWEHRGKALWRILFEEGERNEAVKPISRSPTSTTFALTLGAFALLAHIFTKGTDSRSTQALSEDRARTRFQSHSRNEGVSLRSSPHNLPCGRFAENCMRARNRVLGSDQAGSGGVGSPETEDLLQWLLFSRESIRLTCSLAQLTRRQAELGPRSRHDPSSGKSNSLIRS